MENELPPPSMFHPRTSERGKASKPGTAPCLAIACRSMIPIDTMFCERHDRMLQSDMKTILGKHFRPGKKQSAVFRRALDRARDEILYYQTNGHRVRREAEFEW